MRRARLALLVVAALALAGVVVAEYAGRAALAGAAEQRLRDQGVAGEVEVRVGSSWWRPSVVPALLGADLDRVEVRLDDARLGPVEILEAEYVLEDLGVSMSVGSRTVGATSLGEGSVRLIVDPAALGAALGVNVSAADGRVVVGPSGAPAGLSVEDGDLVVDSDYLRSQDLTDRFRVADPWLLPCTPGVDVVGSTVELACRGDALPGVLRAPLGPSVPTEAPLSEDDLVPPVSIEVTDPADPGPAPSGGDGG